MLMMIVIVSTDLLLKLAGTEDLLKKDVDFDHEFRVTGVANGALGVLLLPPGYGSLKFLAMNYSMVGPAGSRLPVVIAASLNLLQYVMGFPFINYFPRCV